MNTAEARNWVQSTPRLVPGLLSSLSPVASRASLRASVARDLETRKNKTVSPNVLDLFSVAHIVCLSGANIQNWEISF